MELRKPGNKHRKQKKKSKGMDNGEKRFQGDSCSCPRNQLVADEALGKCLEKDEMTKILSCLKTLRGNLSNWK